MSFAKLTKKKLSQVFGKFTPEEEDKFRISPGTIYNVVRAKRVFTKQVKLNRIQKQSSTIKNKTLLK